MRQIIDQKLYDTETGEEIAQTIPAVPRRETLYKTDTGEYFIHREEWENQYFIKYDEMDPSTTTLIPLSDERTLTWCTRHEIDVEIILSEFSHLVEI